MEFITELSSEQWIVNQLLRHEGHDISIEVLDDEVLVSCEDCQEIVINFFREGVVD